MDLVELVLDKASGGLTNEAINVGKGLIKWIASDPVRPRTDKQIGRLADRIVGKLYEDLLTIPADQLTKPHAVVLSALLNTIEMRDEQDPIAIAAITALLKACNKETADLVHPAFAMKLGEMAEDELLLLQCINEKRQQLIEGAGPESREYYSAFLFLGDTAVDHTKAKHIPLGDDVSYDEGHGKRVLASLLNVEPLSAPRNMGLYVCHLESQGFIRVIQEHELAPTAKIFQFSSMYQPTCDISAGGVAYGFEGKCVYLTEMGRLLLECTQV